MKNEVSKPVFAGILVVVLIVVAFFGFRIATGPGSAVAHTTTEGHAQVVEWAKNTKGDFSQLTPDQQKMLDSAARGNGKKYLMNTYKQIQSGQIK